MYPKCLCITVAIIVAQSVAAELVYEKSYVDLMKRKCENHPSRAVFVFETFTCLIVSENCGKGDFPMPLTNRRFQTADRIALKKLGANENNDNVCIYGTFVTVAQFELGYEPLGSCDYSQWQIGNQCFSYSEEGADCEWPSTAFVPHWDVDIQHVLAMVSTHNPHSDLLGIGLISNNRGESWVSETGESVDYFRWSPDNENSYRNMRAFLWVSNRQYRAASSYMMQDSVDEPHILLCVRPLTFHYEVEPPKPVPTTTTTTTRRTTPTTTSTTTTRTTTTPWTTTTTRTTTTPTTTTTTTTTQRPTTTTLSPQQQSDLARRLIVKDKNVYGNLILRSLCAIPFHRYWLDYDRWTKVGPVEKCYATPDSRTYGNVGFVVTEDIRAKLGNNCNQLVKMNMFHSYTTLETTITPYDLDETWYTGHAFEAEFWCAPHKGYCGADQELVSFRHNNLYGKVDNFYPSSNYQIWYMKNIGVAGWSKVPDPTVCWIWAKLDKDRPPFDKW